jgi:predicted nucleotidyltransferase
MATRQELLTIAHAWSKELEARPGVVGIFLYGSLAGDPKELTEFSDVDIALVLEDEDEDNTLPPHFAEHRLYEGIKTDTALLAASTLRGWLTSPPTSLYAGHWTNSLFLRALTRGSDAIILYDPTGLIAQARHALPSYTEIVRPDVLRWCKEFRTERLDVTKTHPEKVLELLAPGWFRFIVQHAVGCKDFVASAQLLGVPEIVPLVTQWESLVVEPQGPLLAYALACEDLGSWAIEAFYEKLPLPPTLEIHGDLPVFWGGNRVHSVERICAELPMSLRYSRYYREQGDLPKTREFLWTCEPTHIRTCTQALCDAVDPLGYDISALTAAFLSNPELARREAELRAAQANLGIENPSAHDTQTILQLAEQCLDCVEMI